VIISREGSPCDHCKQDTCTVPEEGVETEADSDLLAALGGFLAFFMSLIFIKLIVKRMEKKTEYKSIIESIVEK
jgi:molybdopterin/thiamine biosynthesis adenylyltransferase